MLVARRWRGLRRNVMLGTLALLLCSLAGYLWNFSSLEGRRSLLPGIPFPGRQLLVGGRDLTLRQAVTLAPDDPVLVEYVRSRLLVAPSRKEYNLTRKYVKDFSRGQSAIVDAVAGEKKEGYFLECGAYDGESTSVSLFLERERKWSGLLVEPEPAHFRSLVSKHRKAYLLNACARDNSTRNQELFFPGTSDVPCLWLPTMLLATGRREIDLLALDVKGREFALLRTVPWRSFRILAVSVELSEYGDEGGEMGAMTEYMRQQGYIMQHQFINHIVQKKDIIFTLASPDPSPQQHRRR